MKRREFLKGFGLTSSMLMFPGAWSRFAFGRPLPREGLFDIPRPLDTRVNVKPLFGMRVPEELHEGPCRPNDPSGWNREAEIRTARKSYDDWRARTVKTLDKDVDLLDPVYVQYGGDHRIDEKTWNEVLAQDESVDMYLLNRYRVPGLGYKTKKPMVMVGNDCSTLDVTAKLASEGHEIYGAIDMAQAEDLIKAFKVRKALGRTRVLVVSDGEWNYEFNTVRSNLDTAVMREKFGFDVKYVPIAEMMRRFEARSADEKFLERARAITAELVGAAEKNTMSAEAIQSSVMYYLTAKDLMQEHGCNAFSPTCQEFCVSRLPMKYRVTPCLTHSLLKDEGYASGCEGDLNVTFSIAMQIYLADRTPYMGNTVVHDREENTVFIHHDVPGRRMMGYDQPDLPFRIVHFTERQWGATLRYDFSRDAGLPVTFCRMNPKLDGMLVVKGTMKDVGGLDRWGCSLRAIVQVPDALAYFKAAQKTGHHFSMVYGDFLEPMRTTAEVLGMKMTELS